MLSECCSGHVTCSTISTVVLGPKSGRVSFNIYHNSYKPVPKCFCGHAIQLNRRAAFSPAANATPKRNHPTSPRRINTLLLTLFLCSKTQIWAVKGPASCLFEGIIQMRFVNGHFFSATTLDRQSKTLACFEYAVTANHAFVDTLNKRIYI